MKRDKSTGIQVLVVGAGLGGLYAAIELHRQGHAVQVVESKNGLQPIGDFLGIGPSVTKQFKKWDSMAETFSNIVYNPAMKLFLFNGTFVGGPYRLSQDTDYRPVPASRPKVLTAFYEYATSLGIQVLFGKHIVEYHDSGAGARAYAITDKGEHFGADVVVAADGIGTRANKLIQGAETQAISSGESVYRMTYPTELLHEDPFLAKQYSFTSADQPDYCDVFVGPQGNFIILVSREITNVLYTHEDRNHAEETWSTKFGSADVLKTLEESGLDWAQNCRAAIGKAPPNSIVDFKVTLRDPDPAWASPGGRVIKLGDAAHPFIPYSTAGATQALEDGQSLAACLRLAGKEDVPLATSVHTKLRFERVSCAQKNGFINRERWATADVEHLMRDPFAAVKSAGRWLSHHDPEQYVYDNWKACVAHVVGDAPFENTNIPPGYKYKPWTMESLPRVNGKLVPDEGDWE